MREHFLFVIRSGTIIFLVFILPGSLLAEEIKSTGSTYLSRPDSEGVPTKVSTGLQIINIESVSGSEQSFRAKFAITFIWKDPRLACKEGEDPKLVRKFDLDQVWHPQIFLLNKRSLAELEQNIVWVNCEGAVEYAQIYYGDVLTLSDVKNFPFDSRPLRIDIVSKAYSTDEVLFSLDESYTGRSEEFSIVDWYISTHPTVNSSEYVLKSRIGQKSYSRFIFEYNADRNTRYYIWKVIFPMFLIVFMSWTVFWIPPSQIGPQIGLSVTSMLTLIAYRFAIGNIIPNVDYLTRFDKFVFGSTLLIFIALVESVTTGSLSVKGKGELAERIDFYSRIFFPSAFILIVIYSFLL